jgi:hypothetical protein
VGARLLPLLKRLLALICKDRIEDLDGLIYANKAPSPFCIRNRNSGDLHTPKLLS